MPVPPLTHWEHVTSDAGKPERSAYRDTLKQFQYSVFLKELQEMDREEKEMALTPAQNCEGLFFYHPVDARCEVLEFDRLGKEIICTELEGFTGYLQFIDAGKHDDL